MYMPLSHKHKDIPFAFHLSQDIFVLLHSASVVQQYEIIFSEPVLKKNLNLF